MRKNLLSVWMISNVILFLCFESWAQGPPSQTPPSRFSHKGIKGAIGVGAFENYFGKKFDDGGAGLLSLGYGFDDHFTLWLTALGAEHPRTETHEKSNFGGLELNLQYRFLPQSRIQPFGKVGVGVYGFEKDGSNTTFTGSGFALGLGVDWFFSRHFGLGAEVMFKELDYSKMTERVGGREITTDLKPQRDGDVVGVIISLTIQ